MYHCEQNPIPTALRHAALGKLVEEYLSALPPERLQTEAHTQAEEALAEIYAILEDPELDDPACMQKIEAIVTVYHRRLGVHSTRHWEQD
ncbi:MAG: hypothetical protein KH443_12490 [Oscillospiraceae bacterium]|nr:hypothetical protein [Oscillospiraceae bacterium]